MDTKEQLAVVQATIAGCALLANIAITLVLYRWSRRIAITEYRRSLRDAWIAVNTTALSSGQMLEVADLLLDRSLVGIEEGKRRRKWFAYMLLNNLATT